MASTAKLPDLVIRASAGTGKTYQLTNRFVRLLALGVAPETILAATFTRKAAGEILERILLTLAHAANDDGECAKLAAAIEQPDLDRGRCRELLMSVTARLHRLQIGTIDSFFARLASSFSLELGLPPGWRIVDEVELRRLRRDVIQSMLESATGEELVNLVRLLSKGTSARSVSSLIDDVVASGHSVYLQTEAQAWRKVPSPPLPTRGDIEAATQQLQSLVDRVGKQIQKAISSDLDSMEREQWEEMLTGGILKKLCEGEQTYYRKPLEPEVLAAYERLLGCVSAIVLNRLSEQTKATWELLDRFDREFRERRQRTGGCGFDDVAWALAGANEPSNAASKRSTSGQEFRLDARLSHLLLDEFQDTSPLQWSVLKPFVEQIVLRRTAQRPTVQSAGLASSFFCVGDTKQAIYGWRGGDARIFDTLRRQLPDLESRPLDESYRSAQPIIDAVNLVFSQLSQHPELGRSAEAVLAWSGVFPKHTTARRELSGHVRLMTTPEPGDEDDKKSFPLKHAARSVADLYRRTENEGLKQGASRRLVPTIGVLTRGNAAVGQMISELQSLGVPASEEAGNPLTDSTAVRLILSLLRIADHPGDTIARGHVATAPIGPRLEFTPFHDDVSAARLSETLRRQLLAEGYGACVATWSRWLEPHCSRRDLTRLEQLTRLADTFQTAATLRTRDFIQFVEQTKLTDPSGERIRVMNIHQAKGLQFDIVVLPELDVDLLGSEPSLVFGNDGDAGDDPNAPPNAVCVYRNASVQRLLPDHLQRVFSQDIEQRAFGMLSVLYVAMTRAVHSLQMFIAPTKSPPGKTVAGLLRAALTNNAAAEPDKILFEVGALEFVPFHEQAASERVESARETDKIVRPKEIRFQPSLPQSVRNLPRRAPSDHESSPVRLLSNSLKPDNAAALERGTLFHKWFEQIEWLDAARPTEAELVAAAKTLPPLTFDPAALLPEFFAMIDNTAISMLLTRPRDRDPTLSARVLREYPFAVRHDNELINGAIDRLVLWQRGGRTESVELIDFKTDDLGLKESLLSKQIETYRPQMESYRMAVSRLFEVPKEKITARLVFVNAAKSQML